MLADRIDQLDRQARGRTIFGVGPGALPSGAVMMGIDVAKQRDRMDEATNWKICATRPPSTVTRRSYELFARCVTPRFQQLNVNRDAS
jgi:limonene 1,2-monooxygenase